MAFDYTEITPQKLKDDAADTTAKYNVMLGTSKKTYADDNGDTQEYEGIRYEERTGGTGDISCDL